MTYFFKWKKKPTTLHTITHRFLHLAERGEKTDEKATFINYALDSSCVKEREQRGAWQGLISPTKNNNNNVFIKLINCESRGNCHAFLQAHCAANADNCQTDKQQVVEYGFSAPSACVNNPPPEHCPGKLSRWHQLIKCEHVTKRTCPWEEQFISKLNL